MNIFCLHDNPVTAARWMCDKHASKMCVEYAQLLATCFTLDRLAEADCPRTQTGNPRRHFNPKHPSSLWTRETRGNMRWLLDHANALLVEFELRYGKTHFCSSFISWAAANVDDCVVPEGDITEFAIAINDEQKCRQDPRFESASVVEKYQLYYAHDKRDFAKWEKGRIAPLWFNTILDPAFA